MVLGIRDLVVSVRYVLRFSTRAKSVLNKAGTRSSSVLVYLGTSHTTCSDEGQLFAGPAAVDLPAARHPSPFYP